MFFQCREVSLKNVYVFQIQRHVQHTIHRIDRKVFEHTKNEEEDKTKRRKTVCGKAWVNVILRKRGWIFAQFAPLNHSMMHEEEKKKIEQYDENPTDTHGAIALFCSVSFFGAFAFVAGKRCVRRHWY